MDSRMKICASIALFFVKIAGIIHENLKFDGKMALTLFGQRIYCKKFPPKSAFGGNASGLAANGFDGILLF